PLQVPWGDQSSSPDPHARELSRARQPVDGPEADAEALRRLVNRQQMTHLFVPPRRLYCPRQPRAGAEMSDGARFMKIRGEEPENSHREEAIACVVRLVARWRAEVHNRRVLQRAALSRLVDKWEEAKLEPGLLLYIVAATEWLFRARPPTPEDIIAELLDLLARLSNPRTGPLEVDQASLVVEALRGSLEKELAGRRFLVSLQLWAVRDRFSRWRLLGRGRPRPGDAASF